MNLAFIACHFYIIQGAAGGHAIAPGMT